MTGTERTGWRANAKPHDGPHPIRTPEEEQALYEAMMADDSVSVCSMTWESAFEPERRRLELVGEESQGPEVLP